MGQEEGEGLEEGRSVRNPVLRRCCVIKKMESKECGVWTELDGRDDMEGLMM